MKSSKRKKHALARGLTNIAYKKKESLRGLLKADVSF